VLTSTTSNRPDCFAIRARSPHLGAAPRYSALLWSPLPSGPRNMDCLLLGRLLISHSYTSISLIARSIIPALAPLLQHNPWTNRDPTSTSYRSVAFFCPLAGLQCPLRGFAALRRPTCSATAARGTDPRSRQANTDRSRLSARAIRPLLPSLRAGYVSLPWSG
jgi:hypothetical protein